MNNIIPAEQLIAQLNWRYATKQFDPQRKISAADWAAVEDALVLTPSSGGLQPWKFVVVEDEATREKLVPASYGQPQIKDASHLVVFTAVTDFDERNVDAHVARMAKIRSIPEESLADLRAMLVGGIVQRMDPETRQAWATRQAYLALGNLLTSAALLGIDACPMEGFSPEQYDAILDFNSQGLTSVVICALGYRSANDGYAGLAKIRFPKVETVIHA